MTIYKNKLSVLLYGCAALMALAICFACGSDGDGAAAQQAKVKEGVKVQRTDTVDSVSASGDWVYRTEKNNLTDVPTYYAECVSNTSKHLQADDPIDLELSIILARKEGSPDRVILAGKRGGVFSISNKDATVQVRFDNGPVETYHCSVGEEYLSGGLIVDDAQRFISRVRQADSCRIGTSYIHNGELIFSHNLKGLRW